MVVEIGSAFLAGLFVREWARFGALAFRKKKPPAEKPKERDVGDLITNNQGLPMVLLERLSYDKFVGCYITPYASQLGALVTGDKKVDELEHLVLSQVQDRKMWPDYTKPLSDKEHANYAKAMLQDGDK